MIPFFSIIGPEYVDDKIVSLPLVIESGSTIGLLMQHKYQSGYKSTLGIGHLTTVFESDGKWFGLTCCHCICSKPYYLSPEDDDIGSVFLPCLMVPDKHLWDVFDEKNRRFTSSKENKEMMLNVVPIGVAYSILAPEVYLTENRVECGLYKLFDYFNKIENGFRIDWKTYNEVFKPLGVDYYDECKNGVILKYSGYTSLMYEGMECYINCSGKISKCVIMDTMKSSSYMVDSENHEEVGFLIDLFEIQPIERYAPQPGDSGAPVFCSIDGELYLLGQINAGDPITCSIFCSKFDNIVDSFLCDFNFKLERL